MVRKLWNHDGCHRKWNKISAMAFLSLFSSLFSSTVSGWRGLGQKCWGKGHIWPHESLKKKRGVEVTTIHIQVEVDQSKSQRLQTCGPRTWEFLFVARHSPLSPYVVAVVVAKVSPSIIGSRNEKTGGVFFCFLLGAGGRGGWERKGLNLLLPTKKKKKK